MASLLGMLVVGDERDRETLWLKAVHDTVVYTNQDLDQVIPQRTELVETLEKLL